MSRLQVLSARLNLYSTSVKLRVGFQNCSAAKRLQTSSHFPTAIFFLRAHMPEFWKCTPLLLQTPLPLWLWLSRAKYPVMRPAPSHFVGSAASPSVSVQATHRTTPGGASSVWLGRAATRGSRMRIGAGICFDLQKCFKLILNQWWTVDPLVLMLDRTEVYFAALEHIIILLWSMAHNCQQLLLFYF